MTDKSQTPVYESAHEAWLGSLAALLYHGNDVPGVKQASSVGSGFGHGARGFRELTAVSFAIDSPRSRLTLSAHRPIDLAFALANVLWVFSGSESLEPIEFYNPNAAKFSDDGHSLFGAPGSRVFSSAWGDQFEQAARRLQCDTSSRRVVIQVYLPVDLFTDTRHCTCLMDMQFLVRNGALDCIAHMRSQSVLMVMPYDVVMLTMIHEALAVRCGVKLGRYVHCCGSFHYYHDEEDVVRQVLAESHSSPPEMPPMQSSEPQVRQKLALAEIHLRKSLIDHPSADVDFDAFGLDAYWRGYLIAIAAGVRLRNGVTPLIQRPVSASYLTLLQAT